VLSKVVEEGSMVVPAFFALLFFGQTPLKLAANDGCIEGSMSFVALKLRILFWKEEQWENPRVCPPTYMLITSTFVYLREHVIILIMAVGIYIYIPERATRSSMDKPL
jgi:hypothetical protein